MALKPHSFISECGNNPFVERNPRETLIARMVKAALLICLLTMGYATYKTMDTVYTQNAKFSVSDR